MLPRDRRTGKIHPSALHISREFQRLRAQCAAEALPDTHYGEPAIFCVHVFEDFLGQFDPVNGKPTLAFKEPKRGLVRGNIAIERAHCNASAV